MDKRIVYFAHGQESGPWGTKIQHLSKVAENRQFKIESPDYSGMMDGNKRVEKLLALQPQASECLILVGSSMGGWVSIKASQGIRPQGMFLLAPAVYVGQYSEEAPVPYAEKVSIVHGWNDDIVPVENVIRFAREHQTTLHVLDSEHRLTDQLPLLEKLFGLFLDEVLSSAKPDIRTKWELEQEAKYQRETLIQQKPRIPR